MKALELLGCITEADSGRVFDHCRVKFALYPFLFLLLFSYCNLFQPQTNNCPQVEAVWTDAPKEYKVNGPLRADTLSESFAPLAIGTTWIYEISYTSTDEDGDGGTSYSCEDLAFQVTGNSGNMAVMKVSGQGYSPYFDTFLVTNDSITLRPYSLSPGMFPIPLGSQKKFFPCFKLDDSSGYAYAYDLSEPQGQITSIYLSNIGLVCSGNESWENVEMPGATYYLLSSFNGKPINESHLYEGIAKNQYFVNHPDSIIISGMMQSTPAKYFAGNISIFKQVSEFFRRSKPIRFSMDCKS